MRGAQSSALAFFTSAPILASSGGGQLLLYADGRRTATTSKRPPLSDDAEAGGLVLHQGGSSGSDRRWDGEFWVHPLPPDGPVTFVASWLAYGVAETRAEVDGSAIRAAASRAIELCPDDPDYEPSGGWARPAPHAATMSRSVPAKPAPAVWGL
jgi:hypothetical protein